MTIWVDADATPRAVKEILMRAALKRGVDLVLVANRWLDTGRSPRVRAVLVAAGADAADDYIAEHCARGDLVISADVPLAARVVERGAEVLQPHGEVLTAENARERLSLRNFTQELRDAGVMTGGPPPFGATDRIKFANALDRWLTRQSV